MRLFNTWIPENGYFATYEFKKAPKLIAKVIQVYYKPGTLPKALRWLGWIGNEFGHRETVVWQSEVFDLEKYNLFMDEAERISSILSELDPKGEREELWAIQKAKEVSLIK